jgi:hypothetical protein
VCFAVEFDLVNALTDVFQKFYISISVEKAGFAGHRPTAGSTVPRLLEWAYIGEVFGIC